MRFFQALSQRRLLQIVASVAAVGWIVLEVSDQLADRGVVPELVYRLVLIWVVAGILASLVLGWYHGERGRQSVVPTEIAALILILGAGGVLSVATLRGTSSVLPDEAAGAMDPQRVAVLYFDDTSPDGEYQHLADGFTEALITQLSAVRTLDVVSRNGSGFYRDIDLPPERIAFLLDAGTLVNGSLESDGEELRIHLRLLDGASGAEFRREVVSAGMSDLLGAQRRLADRVADLLREWLGQEVRLRSWAAGTANPRAWAVAQQAQRRAREAEGAVRAGDLEGLARAYSEADSLFARAEALDPAWIEPVAGRTRVAYRRSRMSSTLTEALDWIGVGMEHAGRALDMNPSHPEALELRGTLRYWHWLLGVVPDPEDQRALLEAARADLEDATRADPSMAGAFSTLSHLYYQVEDVPAAVLAARRAYEEDAFLDVADEVVWRLFNGSVDLAQFTQAERWCQEGRRRFEEDPRFAYCRILIMTTPAGTPDVDEAWRLVEEIDSLTPPPSRAYASVEARILMGGVLGKAQLTDSANAVLIAARQEVGPETDPTQELLSLEAAMRTLMGDHEGAIALLRRYVAANPGHFSRGSDLAWWWRDLSGNPDFEALLDSG